MTASKIPFRKKFALKLYRRYKSNQQQLHQLNYLFWECTLRCNLSCRHCGSECKKDARVKDMPSSDFFRALDQLSPLIDPHQTMIVLTGGEALVRNDLEEIGHNLYRRGFPWGIVTNGMLLNEERLNSLMDAGLRAVTVSLDGLEGSHNWLRSNNRSFEKAWTAIKLLTKTTHLKYDVVTCVNQRNLKELDQLRDLLIGTGIKNWRIFTIFPIGRAKQVPELQLDPVAFKSLFEFIKQTRIQKKIILNYGCEGFLGNYEGEVRDNFFFCRAGINVASVLVDGSISACPDLRDNFIQGNIYQDNLADVWENRYQIFRDRSWTKTGICADCSFYSYCEGNGMHLRNEKTGELLFCHLKRIEEGEEILNRKSW
jgi:radical SAM enzyme (rSAM/lipoprotein system)